MFFANFLHFNETFCLGLRLIICFVWGSHDKSASRLWAAVFLPGISVVGGVYAILVLIFNNKGSRRSHTNER